MTHAVMEEGHIYVLGFSDKTVKVGRTIDPKSRTEVHRLVAKRDNARIVKSWVSEQHGDSNLTEKKLIEFCRTRGRLHRGKEWFSGISYKSVLEYAQGLELAPPWSIMLDGKTVWPCGVPYPSYQHQGESQRDQLGLMVVGPMPHMQAPNGWKRTCDMDEVEKFLTRLETARKDVEWLTERLHTALMIKSAIEAELEEGAKDV